LLIHSDERLLAAIELKSHVGPSFGNNCNNRAEEALGERDGFLDRTSRGSFRKVAATIPRLHHVARRLSSRSCQTRSSTQA
jgi:hypothetical protein